jgi:phage shock protein A
VGILERARSVLRVDAIELVRGTEDLVGSLQALAEDLDDDLAELEEAAARAAREAERLLHEAREADARAADALDQARDALRDGDEARARRLVGTHVDAHARARRIGERAAARRRDARDLEALVQPLAHRLDEVRNLAKRPPDDGGESSTQPRAAPEPDDGPARVEAILTKLAEELREEPDTAPGVPHAAQRHPDD